MRLSATSLAVTIMCLSSHVFCQERVLGKIAATDATPTVELFSNSGSENEPAHLILKLSSGTDAQVLPLKTESFPNAKGIRADQPLEAHAIALTGGQAQAFWISFGLEDDKGITRSVGALLALPGKSGAWTLSKEWAAECAPLGELGYKREKQSFSSPKANTLQRQAHNLTVEGVMHKLDCGCNACMSRTIETIEDETYLWNDSSHNFERSTYERRYLVQPGEGLMSVARKALGDARLMGRLLKLNPDIKQESVLQSGQQVLVERRAE